MRDEIVARNYAETLFELARREDAVEEYGALLEEVVGLVEEVEGFRLLLATPKVDREGKKALLRRILEGRVPKPFLNFLLITVDKGRQRVLPEIGEAYRALVNEHLGREEVEVTVAREVDDGLRELLARRIGEALGRTVVPRIRVRPSILGGIVVRAGDRLLDGSLRRQLEEMRRRLLQVPIPLGGGR